MRDITGEPIRAGDVLWTRDRAHLGPVQRDQPTVDEACPAAELDERGAGADDGFRIVVTEGGDGAVVRGKFAEQPERFEVASAGSFQVTRGPDLIEIAPDVQPQQVAWVVSGTAGSRGYCTVEAERTQVQARDKGIDDAD